MMKCLTAASALASVVLLGTLAFAHTGDRANDSDMDSIPDHIDICPSDPSNNCEQARKCRKAAAGATAMGVFSLHWGATALFMGAIPGGQGAGLALGAVSILVGVGSMMVEAYYYEQCPGIF